MTKDEKSEIKYRMKRLARKFCRRNDVYRSFDDVVAKLVERAYLSAYLLCLHENKNKITELEAQIEQLQKINSEQKETLKKVRVALIQERAANIINYVNGGVEMFDSLFELLKGVSN